ncbi:hypothetical protein MMC17_001039 [Xylographa soralifera]|nr:hypothetical protein [Xylographa soralifera]
MEHLRLPRGAVLTEVDLVPYVADKDYLGVPFLSYPVQKGFSHALSISGQSEFRVYNTLHPTPVPDLERFLQTWLFFGLLQEVLGPSYCHEDFVRVVRDSSGERQVLTTNKLLPLLNQWVPSATERARSSDAWCNHLATCLNAVARSFAVQDAPFNPKISFSIASTAELIAGAATHFFKVGYRFVHAWGETLSKSSQIQQMYSNGWCKNEAHVSSKKFASTQMLHFLSKMLKHDAYRSHQACQPQQCIAGQIDLATYEPKHRDENCDCTLISVEEEKLNNILEQGSLPLLRFRKDTAYDNGHIELVVSTETSSYIALSHVWADGLGNPHNNALPRCQILWLHGLMGRSNEGSDQHDEQDSGSLYWLDTLCCPAKPGLGKTTTLGMMKNIYKNASHVLVLDLSLQAYNVEEMCMFEACSRVFSSPWLRRLWTLQEGAFAKSLLIQFRDRPITLAEIFTSLKDTFKSEVCQDRELVYDLAPHYRAFSNYVGDQAKVDLRLVSKALRYRSVSVATDEPLCLANLFDLNVNLATLETGRMEKMWQLLSLSHRVPSGIVFFEGPKMKQKGYRWAPATLLGLEFRLESHTVSQSDLPECATLNPNGLVVDFAGILLSAPKPLAYLRPELQQSREALLARTIHIRHTHTGRWWFLSYPPHTDLNYMKRLQQRSLYLSLQEDLMPHAFILSPLPKRSHSIGVGRRGLFAAISEIVDGIHYVQGRICAVLKEHTTAYQEVLSVADYIARGLQQNEATNLVPLVHQVKSQNDNESYLSVPNLTTKLEAAAHEAFENHPGLKRNLEEISVAGSGEGYFVQLIEDLYQKRYAVMDEILPETTKWCVD